MIWRQKPKAVLNDTPHRCEHSFAPAFLIAWRTIRIGRFVAGNFLEQLFFNFFGLTIEGREVPFGHEPE